MKLTYLLTPNSGPTHQNSGGRKSLGCGTAAGATDIAGQRAVLTAWRDSEGTGDCLLGRASELGDGNVRFRRSGFLIKGASLAGLLRRKMDENFPMFPVSEKNREPMGKAPSLHRKINRKMVCLYKTPFFDFPMASLWVFQCIPQLKTQTLVFRCFRQLFMALPLSSLQ
jgi:hypothetical protein